MAWLKPTTEQVQAALGQYAPWLADEPIAVLSEGWEFWAFTAGDHVLRFPKNEHSVGSLRIDRALLPGLRTHLTSPVPEIDVWGDDGPSGAPFAGHPLLPGTPVWPTGGRAGQALLGLAPALGPDFGRDFGLLLRELHTFPVPEAASAGVPLRKSGTVLMRRIEQYEQVVRRVFPLVSCEARTFIEGMYSRAISEPAYYDAPPCLTHGDLDVNTLVDDAGRLSGVIDFGQAFVGSRAIDFWLPVYGFQRLGIGDQTQACLDEAGMGDQEMAQLLPELEFINFVYPLLDILYGLDTDAPDYVEGGILDLNALVPFGIECA